MQREWGDRAVAVQVGAIILFAFVVIAIAGYQASVVPNQNKQIEFDHNQEIQGQLQELEGTIGSMPATRERRTVTVDLGTSYPARTIFVNPPRPTGRLDTVGTRNGSVNFTVENANATNPDIDDFWDGSTRNYSTGAVTYRPNYNVYGQAPVTVVGNSLVYNEFDTAIVKNQQSIFDGDSISLVALRGSLQATTGTASVNVRPVSASTTTVPVEAGAGSDNITISVVSRLSPSQWNETITESEELVNQSEGGHVVNVTGSSVGTVDGQPIYRVEFLLEDGVTYDLQLARVGVGDLSANESETNASYAVAVAETVTTEEDTNATVTVEVRDQYDNPKSGVEVNASVGSGSAGGSIANSPQTTNDDGRATFTYNTTKVIDGSSSKSDTVRMSYNVTPSGSAGDPFDTDDPTNVTTEVVVKNTDGSGTGGGGGGGSAYGIEFDAGESYNWDVSTQGSTLTLVASTTPEAIEGASTDFALNNSSVATISNEDSQTNSTGDADVTLDTQKNGTVAVYVGSSGASDVINVSLTIPPQATGLITAVSPNPDDSNVDATEFVRVNLPSDTDTSGWSIVNDQGDTVKINNDYSGEVYFVEDKQAFLDRWSVNENRVVEISPANGFLKNSGQSLKLRDASDTVIDEFGYNGETTSNSWSVTIDEGEVAKRTETGGVYDDEDKESDWTVLDESAFFNTRDTNTPQPGVVYVDKLQSDTYGESAVRTVDGQGRVSVYPDENGKPPLGLGPAKSDIDGDGYTEVVYVNDANNLVVTDKQGEWQVVPTDGEDVQTKSVAVNDDTIYYIGDSNGVLKYVTNISAGWSNPTAVTYEQGTTKDVKPSSIGGIGDVDDDGTREVVYTDGAKVAHVDINGGDRVVINNIKVGENNGGHGIGQPADFDGDGTPRIPIVNENSKVQLVDATAESTTTVTGGVAKKAHPTAFDVDADGTDEIVFVNATSYLKQVEYDTGTVSDVTDQNGNLILVKSGDGEGVASMVPLTDTAMDGNKFDVRRMIHRHVQIAAASSTRYE